MPTGVLQRLELDDLLMRFAKIGRFQCFIHTLESGIVDVEAARHGCCYHKGYNPAGSMAKTVIRHAIRTDFSTLLEIDQASFPGGVAYDAAELAYFMKRQGAETIVLEMDSQIVAFLIMEVHRNHRTATIVTLDVSEKFRRAGFGTQLLKRSEEMLTDYGVETYDLQVDTTNLSAIKFYKKHGFTMIRTLRRYYSNGHDAYLMAKDLGQTPNSR